MPRNTRNFWIDANIDGRATALTGGPESEIGGLTACFAIREDGAVALGVTILGRASATGQLVLSVIDDRTGNVVHELTTER